MTIGDGSNFGYWMTRGTIALILVTLAFTGLAWLETKRSRTLTAAEQDAKLEAERRRRALAKVNDLLPLSQRPAIRLAAHQDQRRGKP